MAETFVLSELAYPGTYIRVSAEGLITPAAISTGNIGIVGTAAAGLGETHIFSDYPSFREAMGDYDEFTEGDVNLTRGAELAYRNGARAVFARGVEEGATQAEFIAEFEELIKDDVNILIAPELSTATAMAVFNSVTETAENAGKDVLAVVGSDATTVAAIIGQVVANDRLILVAPGIQAFDAAAEVPVDLPGTYAAAAVAGLLSTLSPQTSPTNKVLSGVTRLPQRFSYAQTVQLINANVLVLEQRQGVRVVRGLTTDPGPFRQITTRRITDFAKAGIRSVSNQFVGRLNNQRVRAALQGALDGFLTTMVLDEQLITYTLAVTATRQDEIAGRAIVNAVLQPTFSIDFVAVTLVLE
jgi:hypothetical protein